MSSMRNAVQRRNHKERAQPLERQKWGLLEKHKDYSKRAADHNLKKRKIKALQNKASERNEDEFYFGMLSSTTEGGIKRAKRGEANGGTGELARDAVILMKTQDVGYLRTMIQKTRLERERLEREVVIAEKGVSVDLVGTRHMEFDQDGRPVRVVSAKSVNTDVEEYDDDDDMADLAGLDDDSDDNSEEEEEDVNSLSPEEAKKKHRRAVQRRKVEALKVREEQLSLALRGLERQRARMNGDGEGINKNGVKFRARGRKK